jgi:hypothetical protein
MFVGLCELSGLRSGTLLARSAAHHIHLAHSLNFIYVF